MNIAKKIKKKIKKHHYSIISIQTRVREDEKEREKNLVPYSYLDDPDKKIPKKIAKKFKK